ncbi:MAG TPA: SPOR domain-containing protein [Spirochaetota bacterium]|nr:SPOR domain-containing protein [Spirochaetota bacterium]
MKTKFFYLLIILFFVYLPLFSQTSASIKKVSPIKNISGSIYFPLFVGQKWVWEISVNEKKNKMSWEIISYNIINDVSNDLKDIYGYEVTAGDEIGNWYFIEYDGFICSYNLKEDANYQITRLFPINPQVGEVWNFLQDNYSISEIDEDKVKVQYENEEEGRFGFQVFKKNIGLSEMFESSKKNDGNNILKYTLLEYNKISDVIFSKYEVSDEKKSTVKNEDFIIQELSKESLYVQVSSFNSSKNALAYSNNLKSKGFNPKIFQDKDGYYKILLDSTSDEKTFIEKVRKDVEKSAFIKQRKTKK